MRFLVGSGFSEYGSETLAARKNLLGYQSENSLFALLRRANFFIWGLLPCFSCTTLACDTLPSKKKNTSSQRSRDVDAVKHHKNSRYFTILYNAKYKDKGNEKFCSSRSRNFHLAPAHTLQYFKYFVFMGPKYDYDYDYGLW